jgi:hypothetical protein
VSGPDGQLTAEIVGAAAAVGASFLAYRRGTKADQRTAADRAVENMITGFAGLIDHLQAEVARVTTGLDACREREDRLNSRISDLDGQVRELRTSQAG